MENKTEPWSDTMDADAQIQMISDQVKERVEKMTGTTYEQYQAAKYRNQSMRGGQNLLIKINVGKEDYIHLSLHQKLDGEVQIRGVKENKIKEDELTPFPN